MTAAPQPTPPTPDELIAQAQAGSVHKAPEPQIDPTTIYEPGEIACVLTLDEKQAWVLLVLLGAYKEAEADNWDIYRAAWDVRRRVAEAMGTL